MTSNAGHGHADRGGGEEGATIDRRRFAWQAAFGDDGLDRRSNALEESGVSQVLAVIQGSSRWGQVDLSWCSLLGRNPVSRRRLNSRGQLLLPKRRWPNDRS